MTKFELIILFGLVVPILIAQATWIFLDAKKRGEKKYWLWGLYGLINVPSSLIVYLVVTRIILNKREN